MSINKYIREIRRIIEREGGVVLSVHKHRHIQVTFSSCGHVLRVTVGTTPSCFRALANMRSIVRREIRNVKDQ